jgi:S-formylglutathione hydrolase FrmB
MSSALDVPGRPFSIHRIGQWRQYNAIFGPWKSQTRRESAPYVLVRSADPAKAAYFFITCGDQEGLLPVNKRFVSMLQARHFQYEFHTAPGGHDWNEWDRNIPALMASLLHYLNKTSI